MREPGDYAVIVAVPGGGWREQNGALIVGHGEALFGVRADAIVVVAPPDGRTRKGKRFREWAHTVLVCRLKAGGSYVEVL